MGPNINRSGWGAQPASSRQACDREGPKPKPRGDSLFKISMELDCFIKEGAELRQALKEDK